MAAIESIVPFVQKVFPECPSIDLGFKPWMDEFLIYWLGYGGCDAPSFPGPQEVPTWRPDWMPLPGSDYDPLGLADRFIHHPRDTRVYRDVGGQVQEPSMECSAGLAQVTRLEGRPGASAYVYEYYMVMGTCGHIVYQYRDLWVNREASASRFPPRLLTAIRIGIRVGLFHMALNSRKQGNNYSGEPTDHVLSLQFFQALNRRVEHDCSPVQHD